LRGIRSGGRGELRGCFAQSSASWPNEEILGASWPNTATKLLPYRESAAQRGPPSGEIGVVKIEAPTVREAVGKFFADCEARKLGWEAMRKYRHLLEDRFLPWIERKGFNNLRQLSVDSLRQFRQSWTDSPLYATKNLERMRAFFRFCHQAGWIKQNPALSVKPPKVTRSPTLPFSSLAKIEQVVAKHYAPWVKEPSSDPSMHSLGHRFGNPQEPIRTFSGPVF
jgi:hypothetical protein